MAVHKSLVESVTVAAATFVWVAAPDWTGSRRDQRRWRLGALALTGLAGASYAVRTRGEEEQEPEPKQEPNQEPNQEPEEDPEEDPEDVTPPGLVAAALVGGGVLATVAVHRGGERLTRRGAEALARRGVRRPWSVMGAGWAVLSLGLDLVERRGLLGRDRG